MIEISNLVKKYGDHMAVDHLSLTVEPGKIYGLLGPNGAGKSTTMNIVTGYIGADGGTVKINAYDIFAQPEDRHHGGEKPSHKEPFQGLQTKSGLRPGTSWLPGNHHIG